MCLNWVPHFKKHASHEFEKNLRRCHPIRAGFWSVYLTSAWLGLPVHVAGNPVPHLKIHFVWFWTCLIGCRNCGQLLKGHLRQRHHHRNNSLSMSKWYPFDRVFSFPSFRWFSIKYSKLQWRRYGGVHGNGVAEFGYLWFQIPLAALKYTLCSILYGCIFRLLIVAIRYARKNYFDP